ncbi:caspase family protein [bacterium]|nr:caspase family protein [bacterium]
MKKLFVFVLIFFTSISTFAGRGIKTIEKRTALVIGNADYAIGPLNNPKNDANDMADLLKSKGFSVELLINATQREMEIAISQFGKQLKEGGVGLFYYAGHGMQVDGHNYLIPIDANITAEDEVRFESVEANRVLAKMESAGNRLNMMFLDACRDNPYKRSFRSSQKGLGQMDAPRGTLVAFATAPGQVAADGSTRNGLFTHHLLSQISNTSTELGQIVKNVTREVVKDSDGKQIPWRLSSVTGDFYFNINRVDTGDLSSVELSTVDLQSNDLSAPEKELWEMVKKSKETSDFDIYLEAYPNGFFKDEAEERKWMLANNSVSALDSYLSQYPNGRFRKQAEEKRWSIAIRDEQHLTDYLSKYPNSSFASKALLVKWNFVKDSMDSERVENFIKANPKSPYLSHARLRLKNLKSEAARQFVIDERTGLVWMRSETEPLSWKEANDYCEDLSLLAYDDWSLPTLVQLKTAFVIKDRFADIKPADYWSLSPYENTSSGVWAMSFRNGTNYGIRKEYHAHVKCVTSLKQKSQ